GAERPAARAWPRAEEGARCLRRVGAITITGFGIAAGFYLGAILPGPARALAASARTVQHTTRRLSATAKFVLDTFAPGGYGRFGDGCKNATRLRLTHAAIRARLYQHGTWDTAVYGAPLSQADTLMASLTFNVIPRAGGSGAGLPLPQPGRGLPGPLLGGRGLRAGRARRSAHRHSRPAAGIHLLHAADRPRQRRPTIHAHRDAAAGDHEL